MAAHIPHRLRPNPASSPRVHWSLTDLCTRARQVWRAANLACHCPLPWLLPPVCAAMGIGCLQSFMAKDPMEFAVLLHLLAQTASASKCRCGYEGCQRQIRQMTCSNFPTFWFHGASAMAPSSPGPGHRHHKTFGFPSKLTKIEGLMSKPEEEESMRRRVKTRPPGVTAR